MAFNNAEIVVRAGSDGAYLGDAAIILRMLDGGIARFPHPEPGGGSGLAHAGGEGHVQRVGHIGVPHRLLPQAGGAERKRQEQEELFHGLRISGWASAEP